MSYISPAAFLAVAASTLALSAPVSAKPARAAFMPLGELADAPGGFAEMCARDAALCAIGASPKSSAPDVPAAAHAVRAEQMSPVIHLTRVSAPALAHFSAAAACTTPAPTFRTALWDGPLSPTGSIGSLTLPVTTFAAMPFALTSIAQPCADAPMPAQVFPALPEPGLQPQSVAPARSAVPPITQAAFKLARKINSKVNRAIIPMTDRDALGIDEYWERPAQVSGATGDCEDIAIEKRIRLMEAGIPAERIFYAVSYLAGYGLHTVLILRMEDADYVLDSLSPHVLRWSDTKYVWLRQQLPGAPMQWARIGGPAPVYASATSSANSGS